MCLCASLERRTYVYYLYLHLFATYNIFNNAQIIRYLIFI
jgi:hypothetical protein